MSAAVGAALKKIAISIVSNPKVLKKILIWVLVLLFAFFTPLLAIYTVLTGELQVDTDRLLEIYEESINDELIEEFQKMNDTMEEIEDALDDADLKGNYREAQVLCALGLFEFSDESDFTSSLVYCFENSEDDKDLVESINDTFGCDISYDEFKKLANSIQSTYINTAGYTDPTKKNNIDLCIWAEDALANGWGYVYGTFGTILSNSILDYKTEQYPIEVGANRDFIRANWLGGRTADCVGLIKGYSWLDAETGQINYGTNGMPDLGANGMLNSATEKGTIDTLPEIPGIAVWHDGHIGIYIGDGYVIQAYSTKKGVIKTPLSYNNWTHWLKIPYIEYVAEEPTEEK